MVINVAKVIKKLEQETSELQDHAFLPVQNIKLKVLLDYIQDLEKRRDRHEN